MLIGHKLVISAEDDGILCLGLVRFEGGASEEARGKEKWVKERKDFGSWAN